RPVNDLSAELNKTRLCKAQTTFNSIRRLHRTGTRLRDKCQSSLCVTKVSWHSASQAKSLNNEMRQETKGNDLIKVFFCLSISVMQTAEKRSRKMSF
ncbi:MAG: hypothetical protein E6772_17765, partial [Dysgonomonas sp.]|nr:hypothetical protein [Dysgonomonas sp.]